MTVAGGEQGKKAERKRLVSLAFRGRRGTTYLQGCLDQRLTHASQRDDDELLFPRQVSPGDGFSGELAGLLPVCSWLHAGRRRPLLVCVGREAGGILVVQVRVGEESCIYMLAAVGGRLVTAGHVVTSGVVEDCVAELGIAEMSCRVG